MRLLVAFRLWLFASSAFPVSLRQVAFVLLHPFVANPPAVFSSLQRLAHPFFHHRLFEHDLLVFSSMLAGHAGDLENDAGDVDGLV